jgi:hypothetical protein
VAATLLAALIAATSALALEPAECTRVFTRDPDGTVHRTDLTRLPEPHEEPDLGVTSGPGPVTDLGQGIVATVTRHVSMLGPDLRWGVHFDHCASGQGFHVVTSELHGNRLTELGRDPVEVMRAAMASHRAITMAEIAAGFGDFARMNPAGPEVCGCAAYYPDLRGERMPYDPDISDH